MLLQLMASAMSRHIMEKKYLQIEYNTIDNIYIFHNIVKSSIEIA